MPNKKVAVLGAGSWGTALSIVLANNDHDVRLWTHRKEQADEINENHTNKRYIKDPLPKSITGYDQLEEALKDINALLLVIPSQAIREVCQKFKHIIPADIPIIHAIKGIEPGSLKRVSEVILEELPVEKDRIVVLTGPSHAEEVAIGYPTTVTVAVDNEERAKYVQSLFANNDFRVYTSNDVIGMELGGALKNIIALGAGISDGLGFGDNAKAALITRGLAEITRLGTALGANPMSFLGMSGVGDLIVTCTSVHSRNWRAGNALGQGQSLQEVLDEMGMVVEGVRTTKAAKQLAEAKDVDMPITFGLYDILFNETNPKDVVKQLMNRDKREELDDFLIQ
ncbi:MAG TPA: NAD(P)H-dependent glycerol-3-phosphate dehydrogenase [Pseudogracilibacillus sp.]|nr:NAD(P)H-dependent glycerol-3-phosphate dehydrogenase [Pseudogracilibacillus sp.]